MRATLAALVIVAIGGGSSGLSVIVMSNPSHAPANCQSCGVCCFSPSDEYVWVTGYDWSRFGAQAEQYAQFIGNHAFMRMSGGHCAALKIRVPGAEGPHYFCSVYELRPEICRILERGSAECLGELETKAAEVEKRFPA